MRYCVFVRNWWKENPTYPNGLEPDPSARKHTLAVFDNEADAAARCQEYNTEHTPGRLSRKAEYMRMK